VHLDPVPSARCRNARHSSKTNAAVKPKRAKPAIPVSHTNVFFRRYRAALHEYLVSSGESGLAYAYEFGRARIDKKAGLLQILRVHQKAMKSILETTPAEDRLARLMAGEQFLMEALSTFEMASRGYVAMLHSRRTDPRPEPGEKPVFHTRRVLPS
jgi:hypothetical protein